VPRVQSSKMVQKLYVTYNDVSNTCLPESLALEFALLTNTIS
jgi:hypothetical protein